MNSRIKKIIDKIDLLNESLKTEYDKLADKYGFSVKKRKVIFLKKIRQKNRLFRIPAWKYVFPKNFRHLLSMPFIYVMIVPLVILDLFIIVYNWIALPLYRIPIVKRKDHFIYDRRFLDYLNIIEKINCLYCSYANGLISYATEIAARTERYWCPIKASRKPKTHHGWYNDFADYGNPEEWKEKINQESAFDRIRESEESKKGIKNHL